MGDRLHINIPCAGSPAQGLFIDKYSFWYDTIPMEGKMPSIILKEPLEFDFFFRREGYEIVSRELNVYAYGKTWADAVRDLIESFTWLWREYGQALDNVLSRDAIALKVRLNRLIQVIA